MATRDRTPLFLQFRKSYENSLNNRNNNENKDNYELEDLGLILSELPKIKKDGDKNYVELQMPNSEVDLPTWCDIKEKCLEGMDDLETQIDELEKYHKRRLMPGFGDRSEEEKMIHELSENIASNLRRTHSLIQELNKEKHKEAEPLIVKNAQVALAIRLQAISNRLKDQQSNYIHKLKHREGKPRDLIELTNDSTNDEETDFQLVSSMETINEQEEAYIIQREREIEHIHRSITQLADLFRSLQSIVIDQGSLMDRIDYNVEQMAANVKEAAAELQTAVEYQRSSRSKYCIIILLILIAIMFLFILMKLATRH